MGTSWECRRWQIGAVVVAHGRAHQHLFRHLACLASRNGWQMSREVGLRYQALPYLYYYGMCVAEDRGMEQA